MKSVLKKKNPVDCAISFSIYKLVHFVKAALQRAWFGMQNIEQKQKFL